MISWRFLLPYSLAILAVVQPAPAIEYAHFQRRPPRVNDVSRQVIDGALDAERCIRQQNQLVDKDQRQLRRHQVRTLTILEIQDGAPVHARISYQESSTRIKRGDDDWVEVTQPVRGRGYFGRRDGERLIVTDLQGNTPTPEEIKLVSLHLQTLGEPNPLARFLDNRRIAVGQSLEVPDEVARQLLGWTGNRGAAEKLSMKLVALKHVDGSVRGVFETLLRSNQAESGWISLLMKGELVVEVASCRTRSIRLQGPVALSEVQGPAGGKFFISTNGTLDVAVSASFTHRRY